MDPSNDTHDLSDHRREYDNAPLRQSDLSSDPFQQFESWYQHAVARANRRTQCDGPGNGFAGWSSDAANRSAEVF